MKRPNRISSFLILLSVALWAASFFYPVFIGVNGDTVSGSYILVMGSLFGWLRGLSDIGHFAVYANYFWMAAIVLYGFKKQVEIRLIAGLLAVMWILSLLTFSLDSIDRVAQNIDIASYDTGLYLWFAALFCATVGILADKNRFHTRQKTTKTD